MNDKKKGNILIVDDEDEILIGMSKILEEYAKKVYTATTVKKGLEILSSDTIHCIISDIVMPEKSGVDFIKEVRDQKIDIPFIFFTGHGNQDLLHEAVKYGAFDFLNKPNFEDLEDVTRRALEKALGKEKETLYTDFLNDYKEIISDEDR